jgi:hypothetical protein
MGGGPNQGRPLHGTAWGAAKRALLAGLGPLAPLGAQRLNQFGRKGLVTRRLR